MKCKVKSEREEKRTVLQKGKEKGRGEALIIWGFRVLEGRVKFKNG